MEGLLKGVLYCLDGTNESPGLDNMDMLQQLKDDQFRTGFKS